MPRETIARLVHGRVARAHTETNNKILWQAACIPCDAELRTWPTRVVLRVFAILNKALESIECCGDLRRIIEAQVEIVHDEIMDREYDHVKITGPECSDNEISVKLFVNAVKLARKRNFLVEIFSTHETHLRSNRKGLNKNDLVYLEKILADPKAYNVRIHPHQFKYTQMREVANSFRPTTLKL